MIFVKDAKGNLTSYSYDNTGALTSIRYPDKVNIGQNSATDGELFTYDANHYLTTHTLRDGKQIAYTYDNLGRQVLAHMVNPVDANDRDIATSYDLLGRVTSVDDGNGKKVSFTYDQLGRKLTESPQLTGGSTAYQYDAAGRRTRLTWSDGFYVNYDYDTLGELLDIREIGATSGVGVLASFAYDDQGKPTGLTRGNGINSSYAYDAASRLQSYTISHPTAGNSYTFAYNPAGQMISRGMTTDAYAFTQAAYVNRNYTTNGLNQYTLSGTVVPSYDRRGNTTSAGATTYAYDSKNQLTSFGTNSLSYDAEGRLAAQAVPGTTRFVYDGSDLIAETDASNNILRRYVHIPGSDNVLVWYEGAGTTDRRWLAHDERMSTTLVTDASGNSLGINSYDEYGIPASTNIGRFQYTGQTYLPELGMYYYKARIYSATMGRFMQTDPKGYDDGPNWYNYVHGDPIDAADSTGLATGSWTGQDDPFLMWAPGGAFDGTSDPGTRNSSDLNYSGGGNGQSYTLADGTKTTQQGFYSAAAAAGGYRVQFADGFEIFVPFTTPVAQGLDPGPVSADPISDAITGGGLAEGLTGAALAVGENALEQPYVGQTVYRAYGGNSGPYGQSWTPTNPNVVPGFRNLAGLPDTNTAQYTIVGTLVNIVDIAVKQADPLHGNIGGLTEYVIPNVQSKVVIKKVGGNNPSF